MRHSVWFSELLNLRKRAVRTSVWHKIELKHRATISVLKWIVEREERELLGKIVRNCTLRKMIGSAAQVIREMISHRCTSFKTRIFLRGSEISGKRIEVYRENGVFSWAPWVEDWLRKRESMIFLGLMNTKGACGG